MEDFCWNWGKPDHHRRDCPNPPDKDKDTHKKETQKAHQMGTGRESHAARYFKQLERMFAKQATIKPNVLSMMDFSREVNRLGQFIFDLKGDVRELPFPFSSVSADCLEEHSQRLLSLKMRLDQEKPHFELLSSLMGVLNQKNDDILLLKVEDLLESKKHLYDKLFVLQNQLTSMRAVLKTLKQRFDDAKEFINLGKEAYDSGRPLKITD